MKNWIKYFLIVLCLPSTVRANPDTLMNDSPYSELFSISTDAQMLATDNTGHIYLISAEEIVKMTSEGDTLFIASNKQTGDVSQIDVSFALKPLIFHQDQNSLTIMDNTLSQQRSIIDLDEFEIYTPLAVCNSYAGNSVWVFNQDNFELYKINSEEGILFRSGNLKQQIDNRVEISSMLEHKNKLYANSPEKGILVFDIFGTYIKTIPLEGIEHFQVKDNIILYKQMGQFFTYSLLDLEINALPTISSYDYLEVNGSRMYTLKNGTLKAFTISP